MHISNNGLVELVGHEGVCLSKYKDSVGVWTIGIGATKSEITNLDSWPLGRTITMQQAFDYLKRGIVKYENALNDALTRPIDQTAFDALCSWCYNVGTGWVKKATVIRRINAGETGQSLYDALMLYRKPAEILSRRRKEAVLLRYGTYSNKGKALLFPVSATGRPVYSLGKQIDVWQYLNPLEPPKLDVPDTIEPGAIPPVPNKLDALVQEYWQKLKDAIWRKS